jgi:ribonucleoside-diphosphate reductase beta chain
MKTSILTKPDVVTFKPFRYPWAYDYFLDQNRVHWLPEEITMAEDIKDWSSMSASDRNLLQNIFKFFVQADTLVEDAYLRRYIPYFHYNELCMMMTSFANMESIHQAAYGHVIETLGFPSDTYTIFMQYKEMKEKYEYAQSVNKSETTYDLMRSIAIFSAFTEGLQLFGSFAILLNFPRHNKMKGMGQIVSWSARDENMHCNGMLSVLHELQRENPQESNKLIAELPEVCEHIVQMEDAFIDLAFQQGDLENLSAGNVKEYIRYIADRRMEQMGASPIYLIQENPLPWMDYMLNGEEHANFFEIRATAYSKGAMAGSWDDGAFSLD